MFERLKSDYEYCKNISNKIEKIKNREIDLKKLYEVNTKDKIGEICIEPMRGSYHSEHHILLPYTNRLSDAITETISDEIDRLKKEIDELKQKLTIQNEDEEYY